MATLDLAGPVPGITQLASAGDWESFFLPGMADGVLSGLTPTLDGSGRNAVMAAGSAFVRAYVGKAASSNSTAIPAASSQDRIDRLVLRLDRTQTTEASWVKPVVITGTPGSSPVEPALLSSPTGSWDLPIAHWTSKASGAGGGLTGLVDERQMLGGPVISAATKALLPAPGNSRVGIADGGTVYASSTGASWDVQLVALADTGWLTQTVNGVDASFWSVNGTCRVRAVNGVASLQFGVQRLSTTLPTSDADGSQPFTLASQFRPSGAPARAVVFSGPSSPPQQALACTINTDGTVVLNAIDDALPSGRVVAGTVTWLLG